MCMFLSQRKNMSTSPTLNANPIQGCKNRVDGPPPRKTVIQNSDG